MSHSRNKKEVIEYFVNYLLSDQFKLIIEEVTKEDYEQVKKRLKYIQEDLLTDHIEEMKNHE